MAKLFKRQKFFMNLFTVVATAVFVYALGFMTQYRGLFGLKLKQNSGIADFYGKTLQSFNRYIFVMALLGLFAIFIGYCLEINKKVPDQFAMIAMSVTLAVYSILAIVFMVQMVGIMAEYTSLDFSFAALEGLEDTTLKMQTFYIGYAIYGVTVIEAVLYSVSLVLSHNRCKKEMDREEVVA